MKHEDVILSVYQWVTTVVIELNLCPFAGQVVAKNQLRFSVSDAQSEERLLMDLQEELRTLKNNPDVETTLLIHPRVLTDFRKYNDFLDDADALLIDMHLDGVFQIASFHPDYQFAGTQPDDPENYTNRSPFPMLHILREESVDRAITLHPNTEQIPEQNITRMNHLGREKLQALLQACLG